MDINSIPILLVTANVGSVFEDPLRLLKTWINEFLAKVAAEQPMFLALHLQEVGGKTYQKSIENVHEFVKNLCESKELNEYCRIRMFLDEDYNSAENFTALGNLYFVHKSIKTARIWNFTTHEWESVEGKCVHTGNIESIATKEKSKFPQHFFPECKWSRKGFLRTRWEINSTIIDFVNIHLFHDASNLVACENFPSVYCKTRRRALVHTLERFHKDVTNGIAPYFIFGDFNFRCDTNGIVKKLTENLSAHRLQSIKNDDSKMQYTSENGHNVLTIGKKEFTFIDQDARFGEMWLQEFDKELEPFHDILIEYPIIFRPSYPYEEDPCQPNKYMTTRCPAWCDRILMSPLAKDLSLDGTFSSTDYNVIGENVCMGDHKPVYLKMHVKTQQGIVRCCVCSEYVKPPGIELEHKNVKQMNVSCLYSSSDFFKALLECKLENLISQENTLENSMDNFNRNKMQPLNHNEDLRNKQLSSININVIDADNSKICMCYSYADLCKNNDDIIDSLNNITDSSVCPNCFRIIQQTGHRRKLTSKKSMLINDSLIINQIDVHYLSDRVVCADGPYTPESTESHSPLPESDSNCQNSLEANNTKNPTEFEDSRVPLSKEALSNSNVHSGVSAHQLITRLEVLQRAKLNNKFEEIEYNGFLSKRCFNGCCVIS